MSSREGLLISSIFYKKKGDESSQVARRGVASMKCEVVECEVGMLRSAQGTSAQVQKKV